MQFHKYHGAGNDFILIDNRAGSITLTTEQIAALCHRHMGIGADGLMLLDTVEGYDFRMVYYNADGRESTMCGNGGRCIAVFARELGLVKEHCRFLAIDGPHEATLNDDGTVRLHMKDVAGVEWYEGYALLNTGSPHYVQWTEDAMAEDVVAQGRAVRYSDRFAPDGVNVNFAQVTGEQQLYVRTYERGVEDETMSCGTGVVAAAIASVGEAIGLFSVAIETPGGLLNVSFNKHLSDGARDVVLTGPVVRVFGGVV